MSEVDRCISILPESLSETRRVDLSYSGITGGKVGGSSDDDSVNYCRYVRGHLVWTGMTLKNPNQLFGVRVKWKWCREKGEGNVLKVRMEEQERKITYRIMRCGPGGPDIVPEETTGGTLGASCSSCWAFAITFSIIALSSALKWLKSTSGTGTPGPGAVKGQQWNLSFTFCRSTIKLLHSLCPSYFSVLERDTFAGPVSWAYLK